MTMKNLGITGAILGVAVVCITALSMLSCATTTRTITYPDGRVEVIEGQAIDADTLGAVLSIARGLAENIQQVKQEDNTAEKVEKVEGMEHQLDALQQLLETVQESDAITVQRE